MDDDLANLDVKPVMASPAPHGRVPPVPAREERKRRERRPDGRGWIYFSTMARAADHSNKELVDHNNPFRFCVCREHGRIVLELIKVDRDGHSQPVSKTAITEDDYARWIEDISVIEGLVVDVKA